MYKEPVGTVALEVHLADERGEKRWQSTGVVSVDLPKIDVDGNQNLQSVSSVKVFFRSVKDALKMFKAEETHLHVLTAVELYDILDASPVYETQKHCLTIKRQGARLCPGGVKNAEPACAWCEFPASAYTIMDSDKEIFYAAEENKTLRIG